MFFLKKHEKGLLVFLKFFTVLAAAVFSYVITGRDCFYRASFQEWQSILAFVITALYAAFLVFYKKGVERLLPKITVPKAIVAFVFMLFTFENYGVAADPRVILEYVSPEAYAASEFLHLLMLYSPLLINLLISYFIFVVYLWFFDKVFLWIPGFFRSLDRIDKRFLLIGVVVYGLIICLLYNYTSLFYFPETYDKPIIADVLYSTDPGYVAETSISRSAYMYLFERENDIRQPLFGLFSTPFAIVAYILSSCFFVETNGYAVAIAVVQVVAIQVTLILICKMMQLQRSKKVCFMLLWEVCYPTLLFSLNLEQYVFPVFWTILLIYNSLTQEDDQKMLYIAATGSLITTGILFPLITRKKKLWDTVKTYFVAFLEFCGIVVAFGYIPSVVDLPGQISQWVNPSGLSFYQRMCQFSRFPEICFAAPTHLISKNVIHDYLQFDMSSPQSICILGVILFLIAILGFILNRKDRFSKILLAWFGLSCFVMLVFGWGAPQNAFIVYSYYFFWTYVCLIFKALDTILHKYPKVFLGLLIATIVLLLYLNINELIEIVKFGHKNFPSRWYVHGVYYFKQ